MSTPARYDIRLVQGDNAQFELAFFANDGNTDTPEDLTEYDDIIWSFRNQKDINTPPFETKSVSNGELNIDRFGNRNMRTLWNATLRKPNGYEFGDYRETISSALGKNKKMDTLSFAGKILCRILHIFDKDHCIKSIKN